MINEGDMCPNCEEDTVFCIGSEAVEGTNGYDIYLCRNEYCAKEFREESDPNYKQKWVDISDLTTGPYATSNPTYLKFELTGDNFNKEDRERVKKIIKEALEFRGYKVGGVAVF